MSAANVLSKPRSFGETMRRDAWWTQPLFVFLGLSTFLVYSTWAAFQGTHYWLDQNGTDYLSPSTRRRSLAARRMRFSVPRATGGLLGWSFHRPS